jgi:ABC-type Na+ transport system ATPase subunit NatA
VIGLDDLSQAPPSVRHNADAVHQILECVEKGTYCAVLGPRLSGKTVLLQFVRDFLTEHLFWVCAYVDLYEIKATTQKGFFAGLAALAAEGNRARPRCPGLMWLD